MPVGRITTPQLRAVAELAERYGNGQLRLTVQQNIIVPTGTAVTEFHVAKPDGWPKGSYKVEVFLNGNSVETESFKVG